MNKQGIFHNNEFYGWNAVYQICGLCMEDWVHDPTGSQQYFEECLNKWEAEK